MKKNYIKNLIYDIRGKKPPIHIYKLLEIQNKLYIIGEDRVDKSAIIGSGYVVGELNKELDFDKIVVLSRLNLKLRRVILSRNWELLSGIDDDYVGLKNSLQKLIEIEKEFPLKSILKKDNDFKINLSVKIKPHRFQGIDFYLCKELGIKPEFNNNKDSEIIFGDFNKAIKLDPIRINSRFLFQLSRYRSKKICKKTSMNNTSPSNNEFILHENYYGLVDPTQAQRKLFEENSISKKNLWGNIYPDLDKIINEFRIKESYKRLKQINEDSEGQKKFIKKVLTTLLEIVRKNPDLGKFEGDFKDFEVSPLVAYSGGVDSTATLMILKELTNPIAITIGKKDNTKKFDGVKHIEIEKDQEWFSIKESISDHKSHPCGRCSDYVEDRIYNFAKENDLSIIVFGDMISTGSHSVYMEDKILKVNLPAFISLDKSQNYRITGRTLKSDLDFGCDLLNELHNQNPDLKKLSVRRVLRELRARVIDPKISKALIKDILN